MTLDLSVVKGVPSVCVCVFVWVGGCVGLCMWWEEVCIFKNGKFLMNIFSDNTE